MLTNIQAVDDVTFHRQQRELTINDQDYSLDPVLSSLQDLAGDLEKQALSEAPATLLLLKSGGIIGVLYFGPIGGVLGAVIGGSVGALIDKTALTREEVDQANEQEIELE